MKYAGLPMGMWALFRNSFEAQLMEELRFSKEQAKDITKRARKKYREIIQNLPEFEKEDRFRMNIVNCAMFSAFYLNMDPKPDIDQLSEYYRKSMMIEPMKWFCRQAGKTKFTDADLKGMAETARFKAADRNPYSWNMDMFVYPDGSGYEARFYKCGICTLMKELGIEEAIPAMCRLDYAMSEAGGVTDFVREYTLASGGPYCDCGYKKKQK